MAEGWGGFILGRAAGAAERQLRDTWLLSRLRQPDSARCSQTGCAGQAMLQDGSGERVAILHEASTQMPLSGDPHSSPPPHFL